LASDSQHKGRNVPYIRSAVKDEEKAKPGHWLGQCLEFSSLLWHCWLGDRKDMQTVKTCATYAQRRELEHVEKVNRGSKPGSPGKQIQKGRR